MRDTSMYIYIIVLLALMLSSTYSMSDGEVSNNMNTEYNISIKALFNDFPRTRVEPLGSWQWLAKQVRMEMKYAWDMSMEQVRTGKRDFPTIFPEQL